MFGFGALSFGRGEALALAGGPCRVGGGAIAPNVNSMRRNPMRRELAEKTIQAARALGFENLNPEDLVAYFAVFDKLKSSGSTVLIKFDGERTGEEARPYVVVITDGDLRDDYINLEDERLINALARSLLQYVELVGLAVPLSSSSEKWVALARATVNLPDETFICPVCSKETMRVWDQKVGEKTERHMKCSNCGAYSSLLS